MTKIVNGYASPFNRPTVGKHLNLKYFNVGLLAIMAFLGICYLVNISDLTAEGFILHDLNTQVAALASTKMANEEMVNSERSYYSLSSRVQKLNMVAVGDVEYLAINHSVVAKK